MTDNNPTSDAEYMEQIRKLRAEQAKVCPHCGRCPTCGHPQPQYPPMYQPYPYWWPNYPPYTPWTSNG